MLVKTEELTREKLATMPEGLVHQVYCGLDTCVTFEVFEALSALLGGTADVELSWPLLYSFERALQAPALDMMLRGFKIDEFERERAIAQLSGQLATLRGQLDTLGRAVWDDSLNPGSPKQLKEFFYQRMRLPEVWIRDKGQRKLSTNIEALEKLEVYFHARPFVALILACRETAGLLKKIESPLENGRFMFSYNIAGTETGRPSSSKSSTGSGNNIQNLKRDEDLEEGEISIRKMFIADPGYKLCNIDLEQTESRDVGFLQGAILGDWTYLDACEKGDLHTATAKMVWPELGWSGDASRDREIANQNFYRHFSYRDMSKRGGHLSNYMGTAWTAARSLKVPLPIMESFREKYIERAFPAFAPWWQWTAQELQTKGVLTTPYGFSRQFFGRSDDDATLREAIAFVPQSMTANRMSLGMWRIWKFMPEVELLAEVYDSVCFQYKEGTELAVIPKALKLCEVPLVAPSGRVMTVPAEAKTGFNWGAHSAANPDGLMKWSPKRPDTRKRSLGGRERIL
jgi:DNA polymerase I-like protein with 3'-5' exonuclease and polymerase domains